MREHILVLFQVVGGLALFIFGMHVMTVSLQAAAGSALRTVLARATRRKIRGLALGALVGFLAHSGAATTMIAGFVNAGLLSLAQSVPLTLGANVGTSLSMQLISFDLGAYCWIAIAVGFLIQTVVPHSRGREMGKAILGFGLIFLGMTTISGALAPHKADLAPWLQRIHGETWWGRLAGVGLSAILTALVTSSGAVIGLCFVLINSGIFTQFDQIAPVVLGAHIGTCIVALTASLSMNIEARRSAVSHLTFNVFNVGLALLVYPWLKSFILWTTPNMTRQAANLHTFVMLGAAMVILPFAGQFARFMRVIVASNRPLPEGSYLAEEALDTPELALRNTLLELRRMARLCVEGMFINGELILKSNARQMRVLLANEDVIDDVKEAVGDYLRKLARRQLSRRQCMLMQHLDRCMKDIERIGDYLTSIAETSEERLKVPAAIVPEDVFKVWFDLFCSAKHVVILMEKSLDPDLENRREMAREVLKARDCYMIQSMDAKAEFAAAVVERRIAPVAGYYLNRYITDLDRLVRHAKIVAFAEQQPEFWIKREKLMRAAKAGGAYVAAPHVDPAVYLERLYSDDAFEDEAHGASSSEHDTKEKAP